jgi:hypothetical protein
MPTLRSPFVAILAISPDSDRKIRVNVYYSSSLTSGKEVIIAATTFNFREMLRGAVKGPFCSDMISEHCTSAKAFLSVVVQPADILSYDFCSLAAPKEKNPLRKQFVFYRSDEVVPTVLSDEVTCEPRLPLSVSVAFLSHFRKDLNESILCWEDRCKLERIRQGKFVSVREAMKYGWHQLRITILSAKITTVSDSSGFSVAPPLGDGDIDESDVAPAAMLSSAPQNSSTRQASVSTSGGRVNNMDDVKSKSSHNSFVDVFLENSSLVFLQRIRRTNIEYGTDMPIYGSSVSKTPSMKANKVSRTQILKTYVTV